MANTRTEFNQATEESQSIKDPAESLPLELFNLLHHKFLSPFSIATSLSVSTKWRRILIRNPVLFQELNLTKLTYKSEFWQVLHYAFHLSSLSNHTLKFVRLQLGSFKKDFDKNHSEGRLTGTDSLLKILDLSRATLKRISLSTDADSLDDCLQFLLPFVSHLADYEALRVIYIEGPFVTTIKAQQSGSDPKIFILNNKRELVSRKEESVVFEMIGQIKRFLGNDLKITTFEVQSDHQSRFKIIGNQLMQEIGIHKSNLRILGLGPLVPLSAQDLFNFATSCPNLRELTFNSEMEMDEAEEVFPAPQTLRMREGFKPSRTLKCFEIRSLNKYFDGWQFEWNRISKWVGSKLEKLRIGYGMFGESPGLLSSNILFNSRASLKTLDLENIDFQSQEFPEPSTYQDFPGLKTLNLSNVSGSAWTFFSEISCPSLLSFRTSYGEADSVKLNQLTIFFEAHCVKLRDLRLHFRLVNLSENGADLTRPSLSFPNLTSMSLISGDRKHIYFTWLSSFHYPQLRYLFLWPLEPNKASQLHACFRINAPNLPEEMSTRFY